MKGNNSGKTVEAIEKTREPAAEESEKEEVEKSKKARVVKGWEENMMGKDIKKLLKVFKACSSALSEEPDGKRKRKVYDAKVVDKFTEFLEVSEQLSRE